MEFSKPNSPINQPLIHYVGILGEFDYDPRIWKIVDNHLRFKNKEAKSLPKNLELPKGCVDISYMFSYCVNLTDTSSLNKWSYFKSKKHI